MNSKRLTGNEVELMKQLNTLFATVFTDQENYQNHQPSDEYLSEFLVDNKNIVLVSMIGSEIVGGLVAYCLPKFEQQRKEIYLYDLAVSTDHQRQGIGRELITKLKDVARDMGAYVMFVQADEGDEAIHFYESLGPDENIRARNFDYLIN